MKFCLMAVTSILFFALAMGTTVQAQTYTIEVQTSNGEERMITYWESSSPPDNVRNLIQAARQQSPYVIGYLSVPNTNIQYPVVQNKQTLCATHGVVDNCFFTSKDISGNYAGSFNNAAAIFLDYRNTVTSSGVNDKNTIIYGHNWTNIEGNSPLRVADDSMDKMFAQLPSFSNYDFARKTRYFTVTTDEAHMTFVVFAAGYVNAYDISNGSGFYYIPVNPAVSEFNEVVTGMKLRSEFNFGIDVSDSDKIVTLSTCTYKFTRNGSGRFVVMGRLLRQGESLNALPEISHNTAVLHP